MIDYSGNTKGDMAVAKSMPITNVNADDADEGAEYGSDYSMAPVVKPVMSKMLGNTTGTVQSTMTGSIGNR